MSAPPNGGFTRPARVIETKVITGAAGGGLTAAVVASFVTWLLGVFVFGASSSAYEVDLALNAVPWPVAQLATGIVVTGGAFVGGYIGKHTARPDLKHAVDADR